MIWAAVGYNFKSKIVFVEGKINGDFYYDHIICGSDFINDADKAFGGNVWILQQDNAPPHKRRDVIEGIENLDIKLLDWPPCSPDLNIIEVIWAIIKRRIEAENPNDISELKILIQRVWDELTFQTINALIDDMPRRLIDVIKNNGFTIS